ncbi:MAG: hypothetical protein WCF19_02170, partial [Chlamydiales bacterium]
MNFLNTTSGDGYSLAFDLSAGHETITLTAPLPALNLFNSNTLSIDGSNISGSGTQISVNGNNLYRCLYAVQGNITIQNITLKNGAAIGGNGGASTYPGGGGMGAGGGLFIDSATVALSNVSFVNCSAKG